MKEKYTSVETGRFVYYYEKQLFIILLGWIPVIDKAWITKMLEEWGIL